MLFKYNAVFDDYYSRGIFYGNIDLSIHHKLRKELPPISSLNIPVVK